MKRMSSVGFKLCAAVAELVDAPDLGTGGSYRLFYNACPAKLCHQSNIEILFCENYLEVTKR